MNLLERLIGRIVTNYQSMDLVAWLFVHYALILLFIIVVAKAITWAHPRLSKPKRRVLKPMARKRY